jgi:general secretion pathway protein J
MKHCRGFTLLELMIAVALLAVVAVLAFRGLDGMLNSRERIVEASDELRALTVAFAQIEDDTRRSWPSRLLNLGSPAVSFAIDPETGNAQLQLLRENSGAPSSARVQRIVYRVREGRLERGFAAWQRTGEANAAIAPSMLTWQPLLERVAALQMRAWVEERAAWIDASGLIQPNAGLASSAPQPSLTGLEVALARREGERIVRVMAIRD